MWVVDEALQTRLEDEYGRLNAERFGGELPHYTLKWSSRAVRTHGSINFHTKTIRVSLLLYRQFGWDAVIQTLLHEMTHLLIHLRGGRARHTKRFWRELQARGGRRETMHVSPKHAWVYACPTCGAEIMRMRKIPQPWRYSCSACDRRYNPLHRLYLKRELPQTGLNCFTD